MLELNNMKRVTLPMEDALYEQAKALSREFGKTLKDVLNDMLRAGLQKIRHQNRKNAKFKVPVFSAGGVNSRFDPSDRSTWDILDEN